MSTPVIRGLVVVFVVVDIALGYLAWQHVHPGRTTLAATSASPGSITGTATPAAHASAGRPTAKGAPAFRIRDTAAATMMDVSTNGRDVVTGTTGACGGKSPTVLVSTDGGASFTPAKTGLGRVLDVRMQSDGSVGVIGADKSCKPIARSSADDGVTWKDATIRSGWFLDSVDPTSIASPTAAVDAGCRVVSLSNVGASRVFVVCANGTVRSTTDAGKTWTPVSGIKSVRALNFVSTASGVALVQADDCPARAFLTADGGKTWNARGCVAGKLARAVSDQGGKLYALVDAKMLTSIDGGLTWKPVPKPRVVEPKPQVGEPKPRVVEPKPRVVEPVETPSPTASPTAG